MTPPVKIHSVYADGAVVVDGQEPPRIVGPDPLAIGCPHTVCDGIESTGGSIKHGSTTLRADPCETSISPIRRSPTAGCVLATQARPISIGGCRWI